MKTKKELIKGLRHLSEEPAPEDLSSGAMCYSPAPPHTAEYHDYICPTCGERTRYVFSIFSDSPPPVKGSDSQTENSDEMRIAGFGNITVSDIQTSRRLIKKLKSLPVELDESEYCRRCCTDESPEGPRLKLIVKWTDEKGHVYHDVSLQDLRILTEFIRGENKLEMDSGVEEPLKDYIPLIEKLLGIKK